jgi:hypothetical protein
MIANRSNEEVEETVSRLIKGLLIFEDEVYVNPFNKSNKMMLTGKEVALLDFMNGYQMFHEKILGNIPGMKVNPEDILDIRIWFMLHNKKAYELFID